MTATNIIAYWNNRVNSGEIRVCNVDITDPVLTIANHDFSVSTIITRTESGNVYLDHFDDNYGIREFRIHVEDEADLLALETVLNYA